MKTISLMIRKAVLLQSNYLILLILYVSLQRGFILYVFLNGRLNGLVKKIKKRKQNTSLIMLSQYLLEWISVGHVLHNSTAAK